MGRAWSSRKPYHRDNLVAGAEPEAAAALGRLEAATPRKSRLFIHAREPRPVHRCHRRVACHRRGRLAEGPGVADASRGALAAAAYGPVDHVPEEDVRGEVRRAAGRPLRPVEVLGAEVEAAVGVGAEGNGEDCTREGGGGGKMDSVLGRVSSFKSP